MTLSSRALFAAPIAVLLSAGSTPGQITHIDLPVVESPALGGESFGEAGRYERLRGLVTGEVDPEDPRHRDIVNLDRAPRNGRGRVEYRATVEIHRPVDMTRWNGAIFHTVPNRGGAGAGERALLERGFAFVRVGWQGDIAPNDSNIVALLPVATETDGSPIVGAALEEMIFNDDASRSRYRLTYPAASRDPAGGMLSVRTTQTAKRQAPADLAWTYASDTEIEVTRPAGFDGGAIYEFIYQARDPIVLGLGFAAMRDTISFLRYEAADDAGAPNPLAENGLPRTALSLGISQSGRMLRDFLYQGFNEDVSGRIVFDGIHPNIAGSRKTFTNYQFGQPGRWQKQHEDHVYPGDQFPFTYATLTDPISGRTDGLQERCAASDTCPRIIHSDSEAELWQARASLVVTDPEGGPIELPDNVRVYLLAGTQHGGGPGVHTQAPSAGMCQNLSNPLALGQIRAALSLALYAWVDRGVAPPQSRFPTAGDGGLVPAAAVHFPAVPRGDLVGVVQPAAPGRSPLAAADAGRRLHGPGRPDRRRRQHDRRRQASQSRRPHRHLHRLEPPAGGIRRGRPVPRNRLLHPVRGHPGGPPGVGRPAVVARRTIRGPRGLRGRGQRSRRDPGAGPAAPPAGRGRDRCARAG